MQAVRIHQVGGPEVLSMDEVPVPQPGPGQARVRIHTAGVNFIDVYQRTGLYKLDLPYTLGMEFAGVVDAVGDGVTEVRVGERVACPFHPGGYAQYVVVPAWKLAPLPDSLPFDTATALMLQGLTAEYLLRSTFPVQPGHRVLIHAAAGGVGLLFIQMAKRLGATVYGTVGSPEKAQLALDAGADAAILYREADFAEEVRRLTDGKGVHAVFDSVGKDTVAKSLACLGTRGYLVCFGQSSGSPAPIEVSALARLSLFVTRPTLGHYLLTRDELLGRARFVLDMAERGELKVRIDSTYPLASAGEAHKRLESRASAGKILLSV